MGRGRKGKRATIVASHEDSGEEEKITVKRRGRPLKTLKNDVYEEDQVDKLEEEEEEEDNTTQIENGKKRKRNSQAKEDEDCVEVENGATDLIKSVGFRQNGSRRKNKPRRAAEVGVECK